MNRSIWSRLRGWGMLPVLLLVVGCGNVSDNGSPATSGPVTVDRFLANATGGDPTITGISVVAGAEYDEVTETVSVFSLVSDQDGVGIDADNGRSDLNEFNYSVVFDPKTAGSSLDTYDATNPVTLDRVTTDSALRVALIIDNSGSMSGRIDSAKASAIRFVQNNLGPNDYAAVVSFGTETKVLQELVLTDAAGKAELTAAIATILADGGATNIGGAVLAGVRTVGVVPGKGAVILLTDGADTVDTVTDRPAVDTLSPYGYSGSWVGNKSSARSRGVSDAVKVSLPVYTIGFGLTRPADPADPTPDEIVDLEIIARITGADPDWASAPTPAEMQPYLPANEAELDAAYADIYAAISVQPNTEPYRLLFSYPKPPQPGSLGNLKQLKSVLVIPVRVGVLYDNGTQVLNSKFSDNFTISYEN